MYRRIGGGRAAPGHSPRPVGHVVRASGCPRPAVRRRIVRCGGLLRDDRAPDRRARVRGTVPARSPAGRTALPLDPEPHGDAVDAEESVPRARVHGDRARGTRPRILPFRDVLLAATRVPAGLLLSPGGTALGGV